MKTGYIYRDARTGRTLKRAKYDKMSKSETVRETVRKPARKAPPSDPRIVL